MERSYSKHTARKVVYDDFQALKQACINKGFELYVDFRLSFNSLAKRNL